MARRPWSERKRQSTEAASSLGEPPSPPLRQGTVPRGGRSTWFDRLPAQRAKASLLAFLPLATMSAGAMGMMHEVRTPTRATHRLSDRCATPRRAPPLACAVTPHRPTDQRRAPPSPPDSLCVLATGLLRGPQGAHRLGAAVLPTLLLQGRGLRLGRRLLPDHRQHLPRHRADEQGEDAGQDRGRLHPQLQGAFSLAAAGTATSPHRRRSPAL